ncbi:hypothetical protein BGZ65_001492 [Modicella reniformis]|uniref:CCHC-type domain-containing protein n=1 Tax=Modicella reniformis TaxID=1440133 RepID=A0A9P6M385_9FUNG|nr:hypothetical protein BGZ65_001492 [Modicella reniformis]
MPCRAFSISWRSFLSKSCSMVLVAWLLAVKRYFALAKIPEADRTPHALSYLGTPGPARWFDGCALTDDCNFEDEFIPAFKKEYIPHNFTGACRRTLTNLRMTSTFPIFLDTFKELLGALIGHAASQAAKDTVNDFAQTSFIDNCPLVLQQLIEGHILQNEKITLAEIFQYAQEMDRIYSFKPDITPKSNSSAIGSASLLPSFSSSSSLPPTTPMEIDNIQVTLNNINRRFNQLERNMGRNNNNNNNNNNRNNNFSNFNNNNRNNNTHPSPLTQNERDHLMRTGGCLRCRQQGHFGRDCPKYGNSNNNSRQGRWIFQVAAGNPLESGNASGDQA